MQPTIYAGVALALLLIPFFTRDKVKSVWWLFALLQLFGATSIVGLSALGGSSLTAPQFGFVVLFLTAALVVAPKDAAMSRRVLAIHVLVPAIIAYGLIISVFGPSLFAGKINVVAMRPDIVNGVAVPSPLEPRSGNITQSLYMTGSFLTAMAVSLIFGRRLPSSDFSKAILAVAALHALLGLIDAVGIAAGMGRVLDFLRNANYAMLDQTVGNVTRLSGSLPEPSSYASMGVPFAVFAVEMWARTKDRTAGVVGVWLWVMILASTSSTGMFGASIYALVGLARFVLSSGRFNTKFFSAAVIGGVVLLGACVSFARPDISSGIWNFVADATINKGDSDSGLERARWSAQGWTAFQASFGLGTGIGSFRCSNFVMAVLGSMGVVGLVLMLSYIAQVALMALVRSQDATRSAAAWGAIFAIVTGLATGGSADPGFVFGIFAGFALRPRLAGSAEASAGRLSAEGRLAIAKG